MAYGWQLISDLHPIPGADRPVRRLPDLIDMTFLFEIGWDPATAVITLPSHHPLLGYSQCPVLGCSAAAASSAPGLCDYCNAQWQTVKDRTGWATFVSTRRTVFAQRNKIDPTRLDLSRYSPLLRDQVLAVICMQRHSGRPQLAVMLRLLLRWIDTRKITTLEELSLLRSKPRQDGGVADFCRTACEHLQLALIHPEIEKRKDVWDLRVFGYPNRHLSFTGGGCRRGSSKSTPALSQRWLRETCKEFVYQSALPRQLSTSTISTYLRAAAHLSATLAARADRGEDPAALGRADIVDHLILLNAVVRTGRMSDADHHRYYVFTRRLLREIVGLGLTGPGGPAEGLPADFGVRHTDTVKWVRTLREDDVSGEALPEIVVEQLFSPASLAVLGARHVFPEQCRRLVRVLADTGRRPTEVTHLRWDCLAFDEHVDELGQAHQAAVLIYDMPKTRWKGRRLPIHASTADLIQQQQRYVRDRFPDTATDDLVLWPAPVLNPTGRKPVSHHYLGKIISNWMEDLPVLHDANVDAAGNPVPFDRSRMVAYVFRHTYAQRHADAGTPAGRSGSAVPGSAGSEAVEVLQELLGHEQISSTQVYYQVSARRKRAAVHRVAPYQLDRSGTRSRPMLTALLPSEHTREAVGALSVPFGVCVEPANVRSHGRSCSFRYQCLGCSHFRTDPSYLPELRAYLSRRLADLEKTRAGTDEVTSWAAEAATPRTEEIEAARNLIRTCEQQLHDMTPTERAQVDDAIRQMRRARGDLEVVLPVTAIGQARQANPVLFPTIGIRVETTELP